LKEDKKEDLDNASPQSVVHLTDRLIDQMLQTKQILIITVSLSICSIIIAPIAIGLSTYLLQHPLCYSWKREWIWTRSRLIAVIIVPSLWFVEGIKQYLSVKSW